MFLNRLDKENRKNFLDLAHYVANVDGDFSKDEKGIIKEYALEMQLEDISFDADNFDIYDSLGRFKKKESRKIVLLELMALIYANDEMHEEERKVLEVILREFDFNNALFVICQEWAKTMISQFKQGNALIEL